MENKIRVFEDLLDLEVYLLRSVRAPNRIDTIEEFEVNGKVIEIRVSGEILQYLERLRSDVFYGHNGRKFFTEEEKQAKISTINKEHDAIRRGIAGMIYDLWRKREPERSTPDDNDR